MTKTLGRFERAMSVHSHLQPSSFSIPFHRAFRDTDVVHYHIIHDGYFGLNALPLLSRLKPTIWTWHDPWPMTGHCIYPLGCARWKVGCGHCPRLDLPFSMRRDRSSEEFRWKQRLVGKVKLDIVVASNHMRRMAEASPIARDKRVHVIPFGLDLEKFSPEGKDAARRRLGILPNRLVIGVRAFFSSPFKGFEFAVEALRGLGKLNVPITIVTTHDKGQLNEFIGTHQIVDLGWVNDDSVMLDAFKAADLFVMPSTAEAFGMMAIEAMACGKPVIVFDGTSLSEITCAPNIGLSVPMGSSTALRDAIRHLVEDKSERQSRGAAGRKLAEERYDDRQFAKRLAELYRFVTADSRARQ
ncbi:glycosyltransferase involved in cell wall biosynthesis [Bradyrhizobium sp. CIR48]|uniref:glycosyltransferase n=1 Tax=Bradyrhizobium sp. CIR48 TaxID=2663840 RepID=UPI00184C38F4|nr:glycosyltransferase [Bradyrhizobium sp. CIR48]MBB4428375.1 glycosyltransferase involved in cell wall biosynthesis [Bradyrhizobium sp. CIR48]